MGAQLPPNIRARRAVGIAALTAAASLAAVSASASAATSVPPRVALEVSRIDSLSSTALADGRVLVGWTNGNNNGDTTLAAVRPSGGLLPSAPQVLRTGFAGEDVRFTAGGPAGTPVITSWNTGDAQTPFRVSLTGDLFTSQSAVLPSTRGRFPRYARCADGSAAFVYQRTNETPADTYTTTGSLAKPNGELIGASYSLTTKPDTFQDPTITCDRNTALMAAAVAGDGDQGATLPEHLWVQQLSSGGSTLLNTDTIAPHAYTSAPDARIAPDGRVWIKWTESPLNPSSDPKTYLATRAPGATGPATFSTTPFLVGPGLYPSDFFFDAAGNTHMLIVHQTGMASVSYGIRTAPAGSATFGAEQPLLPSGSVFARVLTDHPDGNPRLLLQTSSAANATLRGIPQAGSGDASTPVDFPSNELQNAVFMPGGDLFVAGTHSIDATHEQLIEGGLDSGAPPTIDAVAVPGLAASGETTPVSVSAKDAMGLGSFTWTISGGALAAPITLGTQQATIPGLQPGTYAVSARAVDRAGNAAEIGRTLRVLDPAAVTPGSPAFADAVAKAGGTLAAPDKSAPALSKVSAERGRKGAAKKKITVKVTSSEAAALDAELIGTLKRGADKGTLVLKSVRVKSLAAGKSKSASLSVPPSLARIVSGGLKVRLTVTDLAGNRATKTVSVKTAKR